MRQVTVILWTCLAAILLPSVIRAVTADGAPCVRSGETPAGGVETLPLREVWRAGGEGDDRFFGVVAQAVADDEGNVYLLDSQLSEVHVYAPGGEHLRTIGREGDGPGEFRRGFDLALLPGGRVGVVMQMPGRIVVLEPDGTPAPTIPFGDPAGGGLGALFDVVVRGEHLVWYGQRITPGQGAMTTRDALCSFDLTGREHVTYLAKEGGLDLQNAVFVERDQYSVRGRFAVDEAGRVYAPPERDRYRIHVYAPGGELERVIERAFAPRERTPAEQDRVGRGMVIVVNGRRVEMEREIEDCGPCITSLFVDDRGELWVENANSRFLGGGVLCRYDVFDRDGRFRRQVDLLAEADPVEDGIIPLAGDRLLVVKNLAGARDAMLGQVGGGEEDAAAAAEPAPLEVICYAIEGR